jgi:hypothetical protein
MNDGKTDNDDGKENSNSNDKKQQIPPLRCGMTSKKTGNSKCNKNRQLQAQ